MKKVVLLMGVVALMFGCKSSDEKAATPDNSRNSLDWPGTYVGTVPCADCQGIDFMLTLNSDNTFHLSRTYLATSESTFSSAGSFTWDDKGSVIDLKGADDKNNMFFKVGENRLFHLDQQGKEIKGDLEQNYILEKIDTSLQGKRWKLVELMGAPVVTPEGGKDAYMILNADGKVNGDFGCNTFAGTYNLRKGNFIHFSQMAATMMICLNMDIEQQFTEVLNMADNYNYNGDALVLNKARMAPLARFVAE